MALHLIKLCVGCDSVRDLEDWIKQKLKDKRKRGEKPEHIHRTRMVPKRADELLDGGSLYWVIRGEIMCRQRMLDVGRFVDKDGIGRCGLVLDRESRLGRAAAVSCLPGLALSGGQGRAARPRQGRAGRRRHAGKAAPRAARAGPDVSRRILMAPAAAWRNTKRSRNICGQDWRPHSPRARRWQGAYIRYGANE